MPAQIGGRTWSNADLILGGGLLVALINWFIPWWYTWKFNTAGILNINEGGGISGFGLWSGVLGFIVLLVLIALFALRAFAPQALPALPVVDWMIYAAGGAFILLMAVIFLTYAAGASGSGPGFSAGISIGFYLGLLTGAAIAVAGYLKRNEPQPTTRPLSFASAGGQTPPPPSYGPPPPPSGL
jgi:hypothetical protein